MEGFAPDRDVFVAEPPGPVVAGARSLEARTQTLDWVLGILRVPQEDKAAWAQTALVLLVPHDSVVLNVHPEAGDPSGRDEYRAAQPGVPPSESRSPERFHCVILPKRKEAPGQARSLQKIL